MTHHDKHAEDTQAAEEELALLPDLSTFIEGRELTVGAFGRPEALALAIDLLALHEWDGYEPADTLAEAIKVANDILDWVESLPEEDSEE